MKNISVMGCGYVGLVSGAGLAHTGNTVTCIDIDDERIKSLKNLKMPFYEPGLQELVEKCIEEGRLFFEKDLKKGIVNADIVMLAVQTPQSDEGRADLKHLYSAVKELAENMDTPVPVIIKSTVPVGTAKEVGRIINSILKFEGVEKEVDVISNPEFLREGCAVDTFLNPDRIVVGYGGDPEVKAVMEDVYGAFIKKGIPMVFCSNETAEIIKYAANSLLAVKISFINQIALLCGKTGADIETVSKAVGMDKRINPDFLNPGPGYGGSCFPKDTRAIVKAAEDLGVDLSVIMAADEANERHKVILAEKIVEELEKADGDTVAVWGLAFKAGTGDIRNSPALAIIEKLFKEGSTVKAYDPKANGEASEYFKEHNVKIEICDDMMTAVNDCDCLVVLTEWACFKEADMTQVKAKMRPSLLFDLRNLFEREDMEKKGFTYHGVGR